MTHHLTIGDRAYPVAAARVWNSLSPADVDMTVLFSATLKLNFLSDPIQTHNHHLLIAVQRIISTFLSYRDLEVRMNYTSR